MKTSSPFIPFALAAGFLLLNLPAIRAEDRPTFTLEPAAIANLQLEFATVEKKIVQREVLAAGSVKLNEKRVVEVTPRIDGMVMSDPLSLGATVKEGDVLCRLQSATLAEMVSTYVAAEDAMTFAVAAAGQERKLAEKNLSSAEQVRQKEMDLTQAIAAHHRALQPLKLLDFNEANIHQFLGRPESADYTRIEIKAPEEGEIIEKDLRRGAAIEADHSLFVIADLSDLWVDFQVALRDAESLSVGTDVDVESTISERHRVAKVLYVSPLADEQSRTVLVRALLKNDDHEWRPGTPVAVRTAGGGAAVSAAPLTVPAAAVVDFDGGRAVFVHGDDGSLSLSPIETGISDGKFIEVLGGLQEGQSVVSANAPQLKGHLEMTAAE